MRHGATLLAVLIITALTVSAKPPIDIFSDDFESGDICHWSAGGPACAFCPDVHTLALWHFDEGSGQTVADASSWGHDLSLGSSNAPDTDDPAWAPGRFGSGLFFTSSSGTHASMFTPIAFSTNQLTVEFWIRPTGGSGNFEESTPITALHGLTCYVELSTLDNTLTMGVGDTDDWAPFLFFDADPVDLDDGTWHYVALTYDGATLAAYLDGVLADSAPVSITLSGASEWSVGGNSVFLDGWMDEVRVSNVARSPAEIGAAWDAALSCPPGS